MPGHKTAVVVEQAAEHAVGTPAVVGNIAGRVAGILDVALADVVVEHKILAEWAVVRFGWAAGLAAMFAVLDSTRMAVLAPAEPVAHTTQSASWSPLLRPSFVRSATPDHSAPVSTNWCSPSRSSPSHLLAIVFFSTYLHMPSIISILEWRHTFEMTLPRWSANNSLNC